MLSRGLAAIVSPWVFFALLALVGCGPCGALRRDFDEQLRHSMSYVAMGDRVALSTREHARLVLGSGAFAAVSAQALREVPSRALTRVVSVPPSADTRGGTMTLDLDLRLDRVSTANLPDPEETREVALHGTLQSHARFEIPGLRARWSWSSPVILRAPLVVDDSRGAVSANLDEVILEEVQPNFPWNAGAVPATVESRLVQATYQALEELLRSSMRGAIPVARLQVAQLPKAELSFIIQDVSVDGRTGSVVFSLVSALRPELEGSPWLQVSSVAEHEALFSVQLPLLDAALRQQTLAGGMPPVVQTPEGRRWQTLWAPRAPSDASWRGRWSMWCLDAGACRERQVPIEVRPRVIDEALVVELSALPDDFLEASAEGGLESLSSLAELARATMATLIALPPRWVTPVEGQGESLVRPMEVTLTPAGLHVRFEAR